MSVKQEISREDYVSGSTKYLLNYYDYLHNYKSIPKLQSKIPFFVEIVDKDGDRDDLLSGNGKEKILGIRLTVNPSSIAVNMAKIIGRTKSMVGWIEDHWGEELDTVTLQGNTAAFVIGGRSSEDAKRTSIALRQAEASVTDFNRAMGYTDISSTASIGDVGLTTRRRRDSVSYREFKSLIKIMNSNGCVFNDQGFVQERKFIQISYGYSSYRGYFESIDVSEDANSPFKFIYTITFKAEKTIYSFTPKNTGLKT